MWLDYWLGLSEVLPFWWIFFNWKKKQAQCSQFIFAYHGESVENVTADKDDKKFKASAEKPPN